MNNYIYIRNLFQSYADAHLDVQRYICTFPSRVGTELNRAESYPALYVGIQSGALNANATSWSVTIGCVEQELNDHSNTDYALNRTHAVLNGLKTWLMFGDDITIQLVNEPLLRKIENEYLDGLIGWEADFEIDANALQICGIPFEFEPVISGWSCSVSTINNYLTCKTLEDCSVFTGAIDNLQDQIDILSGNTDENYYTTGATLSGNVVTFNRNDLSNAYSVDLSTLSPDLSGYLPLSGGTVSGNTIFSDRLQVGNVGNEDFEIRINNVDFNSTFKVSDIDGTNFAQNILHRHSTVLEPLIVGARSNSDTNAHSPVTNNMNVFTIYGTGWNSTSYNINGQFSIATDDTGTLSSTSSPGKLIFSTTPNGSIWPEVAMQIHSDKSAVFESSISASSVSATTIFVANQIWTVELIDAQSVDFYAPYQLVISSVTNILNSPTITLQDDGVAYTLGNTIALGSKISVSASTSSVVNLNILR